MSLIQRCPHFRVLEQKGSTVYRSVLISGCWNRRILLYTEVSSFQGVEIEGFHCIQKSSFHNVGIKGFRLHGLHSYRYMTNCPIHRLLRHLILLFTPHLVNIQLTCY